MTRIFSNTLALMAALFITAATFAQTTYVPGIGAQLASTTLA